MTQRLIMIVLDGLRPEFVSAERTPHLYRLQTTGVHFQNHRTIFPSVTRVCSSSIATGAYPGVHGVVDNSFFVRDLNPGKINTGDHNDLWRLDAHAQTQGGGLLALPTLTALLAAAGKKTGVATTASPGTSLLQDPRGAGMLVNQGLILPAALRATIEQKYGPAPAITVPVTATNGWATRILIEELLLAQRCDYMVAWITDPDKTQHKHGLGHPVSWQSIGEVDQCVGQVLNAVQGDATLRNSVNVVVLSDHGWINYERDWPLREQLAASSQSPAAGEDLAAERIKIHGQGIYLLPGCRSTRGELLAALREMPECGMLLTRDGLAGTLPYALAKYDHPRAPEIVFTPVWDDRANEFGVKGMSFGGGPGSHGGASPYELTTFCAATGPAFKQETQILGPTGHVDLLPTFARILELSPTPAPRCGRVLTKALAGAGEADSGPAMRRAVHEASVDTGRGRCVTRLERLWVGETFYIQSGNAKIE